MLAEYALDPVLLSNWKDFRFYISLFGVSQGRLISRFPKRWKRMVIEAAQAAIAARSGGDMEHQRIVEALSNIDLLMLAQSRTYDGTKGWLDNAVEENVSNPFHAILATMNENDTKNMVIGQDIDPTLLPELLVVPTSVHIKRKSREMAACVSSLLSQCNEVLFIDPYFGPGRRKHTEPLQYFLQAIAARGSRRMPIRIEYHSGNQDQDTTTFQQNLDRWGKLHLPEKVTLSVVRWQKAEMHNRYILTDRGGVMFGNGLDKDDNHPVGHDTVSLLDDKTCADLMDDYSDQSTKLTWLGEVFSVTGT